jgi:hypothetical protein
METWEIVLVLALVTVSLTMLINQNVSMGLIQVLDSPLFQLAIVGLTLAVAVVSPPVAIVAVATIVVVYYLRNVIKVEMASGAFEEEAPPSRIRIEQTKTVVEVSECDNSSSLQTRPEDADVIEAAMAESENRVALNSAQLYQPVFKIPAPAPIEDIMPMAHEDFPNPRDAESEGFESADPQAEIRGAAPPAGTPTYVTNASNTFSVDAAAFMTGAAVPEGYNEATSQPAARPYNESAGQYSIASSRPYSGVQKRELAEYMAGKDVGSNEYVQHGESIDDKIHNLQNGITVGGAPPPNFDQVTPPYHLNTMSAN